MSTMALVDRIAERVAAGLKGYGSQWRVCDYKGKLAITLPAAPDWNEPFMVKPYHVSNIPVSQYRELLDCPVRNLRGNVGTVAPIGGRPKRLDTSGWKRIEEKKRVRKPPKGRDYDYVWERGEWRKEWV